MANLKQLCAMTGIKPDKLSAGVREAVEEYYAERKRPIDWSKMTPYRVFECYCEWHGIVNWADTLINVLDSAEDAAR